MGRLQPVSGGRCRPGGRRGVALARGPCAMCAREPWGWGCCEASPDPTQGEVKYLSARTVGQRRAGAQTLPFSAYPAELSSPHFLELYVFLYFTGEELNWGLDKFAAFFSPLKDHTVEMEKKSRARGYVT